MSDTSQLDTTTASIRKLRKELEEACETLSLNLGSDQKSLLIDYVLELEKWNKTYNLTAVRTLDGMLVHHVIDCLAILPEIERYERHHRVQCRDIVDVGSGAGLPGVVIAIVKKNARVICVDAVHKKHAFVSHVANKLELSNLKSVHARVETLSNEQADLVISRAFSSLSNFVMQVAHLLRPSGVIAAMKSKQVELEIKEFDGIESSFSVDELVELVVPKLDAKRFLVWVRRKSYE